MFTRIRSVAWVAAIAASTGVSLLGSAGVAAATDAVPGTYLSTEIAEQFAQKFGRTPAVRCPDLPADAGSSVTCTFTDRGADYRVFVSVTGVEGTTVHYHLQSV